MPTIGEIQNMRVGLWNYKSGVDGTLDLGAIAPPKGIRVMTITAIAGTSDATVKVDNRDTAIIPAGQALTLEPNGTIKNPVIIFTNTVSYVVEFNTATRLGSTKGDI